MTTTVTLTIEVDDRDARRWADTAQLAASVRAALHEIIADDGTPVVPRIAVHGLLP